MVFRHTLLIKQQAEETALQCRVQLQGVLAHGPKLSLQWQYLQQISADLTQYIANCPRQQHSMSFFLCSHLSSQTDSVAGVQHLLGVWSICALCCCHAPGLMAYVWQSLCMYMSHVVGRQGHLHSSWYLVTL